jgi:hypothetical protein
MSYEESLKCISLPASADLSASQYKLVDVASDGEIAIITSKGAKFAGVLQDAPDAVGRVGAVGIDGVTKVRAGAAVTAGANVIGDATARVIATDATDQFVLGLALETATAADDVIAVLIDKFQTSVTA